MSKRRGARARNFVNRQSDYRNLLKPRAAGFWDMCCGGHVRVIVDVRERELEDWFLAGNDQDDRTFRKQMQLWLGDIWAEKDNLISSMKDVYGR